MARKRTEAVSTAHFQPQPTAPPAFAARSAGRLAGAAGLLLFAVATGVALSKHPLPLTLVLAFGVGLLGTLALALARYDVAVGLGVFLLAAVRIEPAPADLILFVVIAVALVTGRFYIRRVPLIVVVLLSIFLALNMLASVELIDVGRAVTFFAITLYLVIFALWLTGYVRSPTHRAGRPARLHRGRGALGGHRRAGALRRLPRPRPPRLRPAREGPLQGPERARAVPRTRLP